MPEEIASKARSQLESFKELKSKIYEDLLVVHEKLEAAKKKVRENLKGPRNRNGVLTRQERAYIECLEVKKEELEVLFQEDEAHWREHLDRARQTSDLVQQKIQTPLLLHH